MTHYTSSKQLIGHTLSNKDTLQLADTRYSVVDDGKYCRSDTSGNDNGAIFDILKFKKNSYCKKYYKYKPLYTSTYAWPECKKGDYKALTRLVVALFKAVERKSLNMPVNPIIVPKPRGSKPMTFKSYDELLGYTLMYGDEVSFINSKKKITEYYKVVSAHIMNTTHFHNNDMIFKLLKLDGRKFCTTHYGYQAGSGICPECKSNDFPALTRMVLALFAKLEDRTIGEITTPTPLPVPKPLLPERYITIKDGLILDDRYWTYDEAEASCHPKGKEQYCIYKLIPISIIRRKK